MMDESARAAGVRNSMAADTRFAASVRPFATPPIGYGDWGVLVGMHRGASGRFSDGVSDEASDVLRITDVVADLKRRRDDDENENENENARERDDSARVSSRGDATEDDAVAAPASPPAPERRVSWRVGGETLEDAALRKRRQWVEGMTIDPR
jgi:hypothetical protein